MGIIFLFILSLVYIKQRQTIFVPYGAVWKYLDNGSDQGTVWYKAAFDDSKWKSGKAQLGYGDDGELTVVSYGPDSKNKYITTYFRHTFEVKDPEQYVGFTLKIHFDEGAVVYLNGKEVMRANMPAGDIHYNTYAVGRPGEDEKFLDKKLMRKGINVLAAEVHQSNPQSSDILFDLKLAAAKKLPNLTRKAPYLIYPGKNTEMKICWQLSKTLNCQLVWGTDTLYTSGEIETTEYGNDHQHSYTFKKLIPATKYFYRVTAGSEIHKGSFRTAPESNATAIKFMVYGDTRTYPENHNKVAGGMVSAFSEDEQLQSFILFVGDAVGNGDRESKWDREFFNKNYSNIQTLLANIPFQVCIGNHEGAGLLFVKYFPYLYINSHYWSYDYGPAHFVIYDQYIDNEEGFNRQIEWLKHDLANTTRPWKFICLHEPGWTAGSHENNENVQKYIQPICEKYDVSIVFAGHNHYYAHAIVNSVHHITTGGGGAPLYDIEEGHSCIVFAQKGHHFCKISINGIELKFSVVTPGGTILDKFSIKKQ